MKLRINTGSVEEPKWTDVTVDNAEKLGGKTLEEVLSLAASIGGSGEGGSAIVADTSAIEAAIEKLEEQSGIAVANIGELSTTQELMLIKTSVTEKEVIEARGAHKNLNTRLNAFDSALLEVDEKIANAGSNVSQYNSVKKATISQTLDGETVILTWQNPTDASFLGVEVYMSEQPLTEKEYNEVSDELIPVYTGKGISVNIKTTPNKTHYFKVFSTYNISGTTQTDNGVIKSIKTVDKKAPDAVTNLAAIGDETAIKLKWVNPEDKDLFKVRVVRNEARVPENETDGVIIYEGLQQSFKDEDLAQETAYYYRLFLYDLNGNMNSSETMSLVTETLGIYGVENFNIEQTLDGELFTLTWDNPTRGNMTNIEVYVSEIDLSSKPYEQVKIDGKLIYEGKDTIFKYATEPNNFYYFKVYVKYDREDEVKFDSGSARYLKAVDLMPPNEVGNLKLSGYNGNVEIKWDNPKNKDFKEVIIKRQILHVDNVFSKKEIIYSGNSTSFSYSNGVIGDVHILTITTIDTNENETVGLKVEYIIEELYIYGVKINTTNSNPSTALTYTDNAIGFTPAKMGATTFSYGSWENVYPFNQIKPCMFKGGKVNYYLNPNDYSKKVDGSVADITSGNDGDVMIEFPKVYWKFETVGSDLYVRYSNAKLDEGFKCLAHQRGTIEKDKVYISAYLGTEVSSKLRSLSGKTPTGNKTIGAFRALAQANGSGYDQMVYYQLLMLQVLYIIMFKDRDSQSALGKGYTDSTNTAATTTGQLNDKGLFYGETTGKVQMKFCGVEDFYGNLRYWIDGMFSNASRNILIGNQNFNDTGTGYTNYGQGATANLNGYIDRVQGGTETGFIIKGNSGTSTTYYADSGDLGASQLPSFGGNWNHASYAGAFRLRLIGSASEPFSYIGARLMFC